MRYFAHFLIACVVATVKAANFPVLNGTPLKDDSVTHQRRAAAALRRSGMLQHYGHPPGGCEKDEAALQIQGVPGMICSPHCADIMPCPTDVPDGVTAKPSCAIQDQEGHMYCVLICNPNADECGDMTCQPVQGLGVCTFDE